VCDLKVQQSQTKLQEKRPQVAKKMNKLLLLYRVFQGFYFSRELGSEIQTNERNKICCQGLKFQTNEEAKKSPAKFSKEFSFCFPEFLVHRFSDTTKKKTDNLQILGSQIFSHKQNEHINNLQNSQMHYFLRVGSVCSRKEIERTQNSHNPKTVIFPWKTFA
jgi:transposase